MIVYRKANLFDSHAEALVNTVNCVGVMGKGIAHQFARAFPKMAAAYAKDCRAGIVLLGEVRCYEDVGKTIINFPTKGHWRAGSRLQDIEEGLTSLRNVILSRHIYSIAVPPLGCGNGGLSWDDVKPLIVSALDVEKLRKTLIEVYEPSGDFSSKVAKAPKLSLSHFILASLRLRLKSPNKLKLQKAAYWFNVHLGEPYFHFVHHKFGPYAPSFEPMMVTIKDYLDAHQLKTSDLFQDGSQRSLQGRDADRFVDWIPHIDWAADFCNQHADQLEALATAHAVVREAGPLTDDQIAERFIEWSVEKAQRYTKSDVIRSIQTLSDLRLIERQLHGYVVATEWQERSAQRDNGDSDPLRR